MLIRCNSDELERDKGNLVEGLLVYVVVLLAPKLSLQYGLGVHIITASCCYCCCRCHRINLAAVARFLARSC